ncbi:conserved hypothetical protein [Culex quinquefasciatus]|uniref:Uncharacterized protein n=1 Tax=Culex quinquefasciatus TaxID=7176 RepID=B0WP62_CULQU|nr:conserved hypothetical protein [Culex quinquefasciatus]|eukprot:XP_001850496.1 conserved hypothetical protein [Culex quinquefasciatus]
MGFIKLTWTALTIFLIGATGNEVLREKRHLLLTEDSATGILAAIAIPLEKEKPHGVDIFCSYNFEMNYGMTTEASDWTDPWKRFRVKETENGLAEAGGEGGGERRRKRSPARGITRRKVYHVIEEQLRVWNPYTISSEEIQIPNQYTRSNEVLIS